MASNNSKSADNITSEAKLKEAIAQGRGAIIDDGWERYVLLEDCKLISAASKPIGTAVFELTVENKHINRAGNLHGGCTATLFDSCTSCALFPISYPGFWSAGGVSRTLNCTYLRPIPLGTTVLIECEVVHAGKKLGMVKGVMKRKTDGALLATCEHGKYNTDPDLGLGPAKL